MSGLRPIEFDHFFRRLHARGMDTTKLAAAVNLSRPTVTRVLNGSRRRGHVWKKLLPLLTAEEVAILDVAQCSSWNKTRVENRPKWTPEKAAQFAQSEAISA